MHFQHKAYKFESMCAFLKIYKYFWELVCDQDIFMALILDSMSLYI